MPAHATPPSQLTKRDLPVAFVSSLVGGLRDRHRFADVRTYVMFLGYPRSGHSLVGSLLDAHPDAVVAHELDALRLFQAGFRRNQVFSMILENDRRFTAGGRRGGGDYGYVVPGQWQGRYRELRVIGDKSAERSTRRLLGRRDLLDVLRRQAGDDVRFLHVVRNPYDNIATMWRRSQRESTLEEVAERYLTLCRTVGELKHHLPTRVLDVRHEDLVADAPSELARMCAFLGLSAPEDYVQACTGIVFASPRQTRGDAPWTPELRKTVEEEISRHEPFAAYSFEG